MLWQVLCQTTLGSRHFISCILLQFSYVLGFCTDTVYSQTFEGFVNEYLSDTLIETCMYGYLV